MARKAQSGEVNKSQAIRELLKQNPEIGATEAIDTLAKRGVKATANLYYFVKGKMTGRKSRRRKIRKNVEKVMANGAMASTTATSDVLATIKKVKGVAAEVGGLKKLAALVEALSE
jgi:hypothetical protein